MEISTYVNPEVDQEKFWSVLIIPNCHTYYKVYSVIFDYER